ncbi:hypothetical protein [Zavarzinia sp. CC-PAN008]|uniref:hypothetical protein n=1 Tax=Zavarzinia sp. CC-PAN008 TaxID=3243332 RepID=UPI003F749FF2
MSGLEDAAVRLADVLERLEANIARAGTSGFAGLKAENQRLAREVEALRNENRELKDATEQVARRLDGAIGEIDALLGS